MKPPICWTVDVTVEFIASDVADALHTLQVLKDSGGLIDYNALTLIQSEPEEDEPVGGVRPGVNIVMPVLDTAKIYHNVEEMYE